MLTVSKAQLEAIKLIANGEMIGLDYKNKRIVKALIDLKDRCCLATLDNAGFFVVNPDVMSLYAMDRVNGE